MLVKCVVRLLCVNFVLFFLRSFFIFITIIILIFLSFFCQCYLVSGFQSFLFVVGVSLGNEKIQKKMCNNKREILQFHFNNHKWQIRRYETFPMPKNIRKKAKNEKYWMNGKDWVTKVNRKWWKKGCHWLGRCVYLWLLAFI